MDEFEKAVRKALIDRNMSLTSLASELGVSASYVYEIMHGTRKAPEMRERIKTFLELGGRI